MNKRVLLNLSHATHITQFERQGGGFTEWEYVFLLVGGTLETFKTQNREDVDYIEGIINDVIFNKLELPPPQKEVIETEEGASLYQMGLFDQFVCCKCHFPLGRNNKCMNCLLAREIK